LIFRSFVSRNPELLKRAYTTYVRPLVEYCTSVWSPHLIKDINKIENVQRYFTRRIFPKEGHTYDERLKLLGLDLLELRRLKFDLKMYFKILHGQINLNIDNFFVLLPASHGTRSHNLQIQKQVYRNNTLNNTFSNRSIDCWNSLPTETVTATSFIRFKNLLDLTDYEFYKPYLLGRASESL
jgi:hypothetical protein